MFRNNILRKAEDSSYFTYNSLKRAFSSPSFSLRQKYLFDFSVLGVCIEKVDPITV